MATAGGGSVTYSFVADNPGTFIYESGTDPDVQVRLGLFGALIVRPTLGVDYANTTAPTAGSPRWPTPTPPRRSPGFGVRNDEEFLILLSEIDPYLNQSVEIGTTFNMNNYHPRYWLVNGRGFPDSIADNYASWLPNQPYGALARSRRRPLRRRPTHPYPGLARYINVGTRGLPLPPARQQRQGHRQGWPPARRRRRRGPLLREVLAEHRPRADLGRAVRVVRRRDTTTPTTNPVPVEVPQVANQVYGMFYSGSPYLGVTGPQPPGNQSLNQCGEFYIIAHNHALYQITSWGVNMTGPITYMRIDPADTSNCP